jgi:hypothetical protein
MEYDNAIQLLQKYQKICRVLKLEDDLKRFEEIIDFISNNGQKESTLKVLDTAPKKKYGENNFKELIENSEIQLESYIIHSGIISNKDNIADFWNSLDADTKENFTIFELNVMLSLISNKFNKYMKKDKKRIISFLTDVVKSKRMEKSYKEIHV